MKRIIVVALVVIMILGLCACAKSEDKASDVQQSESSVTETVAVETDAKEKETAAQTVREAETEEEIVPEDNSNGIIHLVCTMTSEGMSVGENYEGEAYVRYPKFDLYESDEEKYPMLQKALEKLNQDYEKEYDEHLTSSHEIGEEALADGAEMQINFYDHLTPEICRADSHILSIREFYDSYTGGVHGYSAFYGDNFDSSTGRKLVLSDVVADQDAFRETVKEKLISQYPGEAFDDLDTALADMFSVENGEMPWTMDYSGVTLYFNPYHIAAYASGMQVITVPFNENPKMFVQDYLVTPDVYAEQINDKVPVILDVNGDGINETVFVSEELPEEEMNDEADDYGYKTWTVYCGGDSLTVSDYCYRANFYLVHANDQYYMHIFEISDNDYSLFNSVDLKTMTDNKDRAFNANLRMHDTHYDSDDTRYRSAYSEDIYTDPESVYISSRIEVLGSNSGIKHYNTGSDGWLRSDDEYYDVYTYAVYTAKEDIPCTKVDESGNENGEATLQKGKYYHLVRTDGKTYADVQILNEDEVEKYDVYPYVWATERKGPDSSRQVYRIPYDSSSYPHTIDGTPEEELFDGIMYAG